MEGGGRMLTYTCEVLETSSYGIPVWRDKRGQPASPLLLGKVWGRERGGMGGGGRMPAIHVRYQRQVLMVSLCGEIREDNLSHHCYLVRFGEGKEGKYDGVGAEWYLYMRGTRHNSYGMER